MYICDKKQEGNVDSFDCQAGNDSLYTNISSIHTKKCLTGTGIPQGANIAANLSLCLLWMYQFHSLFFCKVNLEFCNNKYFK
jgi:hypothetical protein